jgi:hypothetical protein
MQRLAALSAVIASALVLMSCATSQPDMTVQQPPQATSQADLAKMCRPGFYFCPGKVMGCCPNGWGCASTHCVRPGSQAVDRRAVDRQAVDRQAVDRQAVGKQTVDRRCSPGFYFCPGEVMGCCPNGWRCASTHCVRPPRQRDL